MWSSCLPIWKRAISKARLQPKADRQQNHGRLETRTCQVIADQQILMQLRDAPVGRLTIGCQSTGETENEEETTEEGVTLSSLASNAQHLLKAVRTHWSIENELHWVLDIAFREDESRIRKDHGPENFAVLRHIALNLVKQEKTQKASVKGKRLKAGWDEDYLLKILSGLF
jgi:predicted transposase YbfD/YdcC